MQRFAALCSALRRHCAIPRCAKSGRSIRFPLGGERSAHHCSTTRYLLCYGVAVTRFYLGRADSRRVLRHAGLAPHFVYRATSLRRGTQLRGSFVDTWHGLAPRGAGGMAGGPPRPTQLSFSFLSSGCLLDVGRAHTTRVDLLSALQQRGISYPFKRQMRLFHGRLNEWW